ncbi:MAG: hypothetical protein L0154_12800 [Chloroflexi bacterium]|nr:hypothetical protein [Chloroflexota bacterium]
MRKLFLIFLIGSMLCVAQAIYAQDPRDETIAVINAPAEGEQVSGQVSITGSASHPSLFAGYELEFDNLADASTIWIPIEQRVTQQVTNNVLQIWDTVALRVPDGQYQLRLSVFLTDSDEPVIYVVSNIQVINTAPTSLPTFQAGDVAPTTAAATEGAPPIVQPPTRTPNPTSEALVIPVDDGTADTSRGEISLNLGGLQSAFCLGVYIAIAFFAAFGGYVWLRNRIRPTARQFWWQIRNEFDQDR